MTHICKELHVRGVSHLWVLRVRGSPAWVVKRFVPFPFSQMMFCLSTRLYRRWRLYRRLPAQLHSVASWKWPSCSTFWECNSDLTCFTAQRECFNAFSVINLFYLWAFRICFHSLIIKCVLGSNVPVRLVSSLTRTLYRSRSMPNSNHWRSMANLNHWRL